MDVITGIIFFAGIYDMIYYITISMLPYMFRICAKCSYSAETDLMK